MAVEALEGSAAADFEEPARGVDKAGVGATASAVSGALHGRVV